MFQRQKRCSELENTNQYFWELDCLCSYYNETNLTKVTIIDLSVQ